MSNTLYFNNSTGQRRTAKNSTSKGQVIAVGETIAVTAAQLTLGALFGSVRLPKGAEIVGVILRSTDVDTNGTPTVALSIGDSGQDDRLLASSTVGQAGGVTQTLNASAVGYQYTAETLVQIKVKTAPATAAAGTFYYAVLFVTE